MMIFITVTGPLLETQSAGVARAWSVAVGALARERPLACIMPAGPMAKRRARPRSCSALLLFLSLFLILQWSCAAHHPHSVSAGRFTPCVVGGGPQVVVWWYESRAAPSPACGSAAPSVDMAEGAGPSPVLRHGPGLRGGRPHRGQAGANHTYSASQWPLE